MTMKTDPRHAALTARIEARVAADPAPAPGAAPAVRRFLAAMTERRAAPDAPPAAIFEAAAASESTLGILLRALPKYAPEINLAAGRDLRAGYYAARPRAAEATPRRAGPEPIPHTAPDVWPIEWALLFPALLHAPIRETSLRRVIAWVTRCAKALSMTDADPDWSRYMAISIAERLAADGCRPITVAGCLDGLVTLGRHGGVGDASLAGLREMRAYSKAQATRSPKLKVARLQAFHEKGGVMFVVETIARLLAEADARPASSAGAQRRRRTAAILAIALHAWARTGDIARWRLGEELVREPSGVWRLAWLARKNNAFVDSGEVPLELCKVLDEHLLGGRPRRFAALRYRELSGYNWLSLSDRPTPAKQPSILIEEAIGIPAHYLRTAIADLMRRADPTEAARMIAGVLGHHDLRTGEEYRALCAGDAAARHWVRMRSDIAADAGAQAG